MTSSDSTARRFKLVRTEDVSGTSGLGVVAEGIEFSNGQCAIHWTSQLECIGIYSCIRVLESVHGHGGKTRVEWIDSASASAPELVTTPMLERIKREQFGTADRGAVPRSF